MRFTCLIINFLSALPLNEDQCWKGGRGRDGECKERELKAECPLGIQAVPCQIQKQASLSRLSLCSYFIPFVWGTWWTGLQRRLQWAHQSTPTDCGPTDALEMGINFFVENIETAYTKWGKWNQLLFFLLLFFLLFDLCFRVFSLPGFPVGQSCWVQSDRQLIFVRCSFGEVFVLLSVFLSHFLSLSHSTLSLTLLTSSRSVQPTWLWAKINAHMCLQLLYAGLMKVTREKDRWAKSGDSQRVHWLQKKKKNLSNRASVYWNNARIINWEILSWFCFVLPQVPFVCSVMDEEMLD